MFVFRHLLFLLHSPAPLPRPRPSGPGVELRLLVAQRVQRTVGERRPLMELECAVEARQAAGIAAK